MGVFDRCWEVFRPQPPEPWVLWAQRHYQTFESGTGRIWDHYSSPHIGAPGGPAEAYEDPHVREIDLMFATRLAKTQFCIGALLWTSHVMPSPVMLTSATRDLVQDTVSERVWRSADAAGVFGKLPREGKRSKRKVRLPGCRWNVGWAENPRSLADKSAKLLWIGEADKWRWLKGTKEADPFNLAKERPKEWPDRKILVESSPSIAKASRIEAGFQSGWGCHLFVPCPKCLKYQRLHLGKGEPGSIWYAKDPSGRRDPQLAMRTACYVCAYCEHRIGEDARPWMMRRGVWCPAGCEVDHEAAAALFDGVPEGVSHHREDLPPEQRTYRWRGWEQASWIRGTPSRPGEIASYQLSTLYSLSSGWGPVVKEFLESIGKPGGLQNFINSWLAETWEEKKQTEEWESLTKKLICQVPQKIVPQEASIVTVGIDRQQTHFVFDGLAFAPGKKPWTIDYGYIETLTELRTWLLATYPHQDGGPEVPITRAFIDVNYHPTDEDGSTIHLWIKETNRLARAKGLPLQVFACRGANRELHVPYRVHKMGADSHLPGATLVEVDHPHTQDWLDKRLFGQPIDEKIDPGAAGDEVLLRLFQAAVHEHEDYVKQLLNEHPADFVSSKTKKTSRVWAKVDENMPNDHRDGTRYGYAAFLHATRGGPVPSRAQVRAATLPAGGRAKERGQIRTPDGRAFLITERR